MLANFTKKFLVSIFLFLHISFTQIYQFYHFHDENHHSDFHHDHDAKIKISVHPISNDATTKAERDHHDANDVHFKGDWIFITQNVKTFTKIQFGYYINSISEFSSRLDYIHNFQTFTPNIKSKRYLLPSVSRSPPILS
jgi:hypothetical protein